VPWRHQNCVPSDLLYSLSSHFCLPENSEVLILWSQRQTLPADFSINNRSLSCLKVEPKSCCVFTASSVWETRSQGHLKLSPTKIKKDTEKINLSVSHRDKWVPVCLCGSLRFPVGPCDHGMARLQVEDGGTAFNMEGICEYIE
jgi:hypothetical protein